MFTRLEISMRPAEGRTFVHSLCLSLWSVGRIKLPPRKAGVLQVGGDSLALLVMVEGHFFFLRCFNGRVGKKNSRGSTGDQLCPFSS